MTGAERAIRDAAAAIVDAAALDEPALGGARPTAIYWATVELERAWRELAAILGRPFDAVDSARDAALGATVRLARPFGPPPEPAIVVVEPDTEGRLAGLLARHGEGVVAVDLEVDGRTRRLSVTSGRGGRPRTSASGRPPSGHE